MNTLTAGLLVADFVFFVLALYFTYESIREREPRAPKVGAGLALVSLVLAGLIIWVPGLRIIIALGFGMGAVFGGILLIPGRPDPKALKGADGHLVSEPVRPDERDIPFARVRSVPPGTEYYRKYYAMHPEKEEADAKRREKGLLGEPGGIDGGYRPNVSMMEAAFDMPHFLGPYAVAEPEPGVPPAKISPERATQIVKEYALHIGADMVGICKVNPNWVYSHRGEIFYDRWEDWGKEIDPAALPPFAVVMLTEMDSDHVYGAPHTPTVAESARGYSRGAYLSTLLARWFAHMGYRGIAQNTRRYDIALPPLAVDAGLGEVGRLGYLMAPKFGARVRIFATLTDMPLVPDKPISIGADEFCKRCKKCAESCPSSSIPMEEKTVHRGALKWKLNEDTCFEYWSKVGTDCSICMAICPFSRPNTFLHKMVRWFVARSPVARKVFPAIDNFLYGKVWRPKPVPKWLEYPKGKEARKEAYGLVKNGLRG
ncbi:MAG: reductive dehalogenase [Deltaproteobacteria bacterium]|nr:reductive dehalogenase [Deltaproteobacteria bacterium]